MKTHRIHYLQHVSFEEPGYIENWAKANNHRLTATKFFKLSALPEIDDFDWLIIMGGPMSVNDEAIYPWLKAEKEFIKSSIEANKTVIGICLGAQLLAEVLGSKVYPGKKKEIGWFPVTKAQQANDLEFLKAIPKKLIVLHWHGDTFDLPNGAKHLMQTNICPNQAFLYGNRVLGFQFHLEATPDALKKMVDNCRHELVPEEFVQTEQEILNGGSFYRVTNNYLSGILDYLAKES
jgi:GMP synthase-like glutamine amidotransferase